MSVAAGAGPEEFKGRLAGAGVGGGGGAGGAGSAGGTGFGPGRFFIDGEIIHAGTSGGAGGGGARDEFDAGDLVLRDGDLLGFGGDDDAVFGGLVELGDDAEAGADFGDADFGAGVQVHHFVPAVFFRKGGGEDEGGEGGEEESSEHPAARIAKKICGCPNMEGGGGV